MNKKNLFIISLLVLSSNSYCKQIKSTEQEQEDQVQNSYERNFIKKLRQMHEEFEKEVDQMFGDFFDNDTDLVSKNASKNVKRIKTSVEQDKVGNKWVVISIELPDSNVSYGDIKIKAKGNNLEGSLDYNDHSLKFYVIRGRQFSTSVEYKEHFTKNGKETKDKDNQEEKYEKVFASVSAQSRSIPLVGNLEKAQALIENNKLVIKLPSAQPRQDWTTIKVAKQSPVSAEQKELKSADVVDSNSK
jgi:hypothetical protein